MLDFISGRNILLGHPLSLLRPSLTNGPGWRVDFWVQGCSIRCTANCLNPQFLSPEGGYLYRVEDVLQAILRVVKESFYQIEGITVLGGEPTDQMEAVGDILEAVQEAGFSTMVYTGQTFEALQSSADPMVRRFLNATDILLDGPFVKNLYGENLMWRGSRNQCIRCLSSRYTMEGLQDAFHRQGKGFSIRIGADGSISVSGLQSRMPAIGVEPVLMKKSEVESG